MSRSCELIKMVIFWPYPAYGLGSTWASDDNAADCLCLSSLFLKTFLMLQSLRVVCVWDREDMV